MKRELKASPALRALNLISGNSSIPYEEGTEREAHQVGLFVRRR